MLDQAGIQDMKTSNYFFLYADCVTKYLKTYFSVFIFIGLIWWKKFSCDDIVYFNNYISLIF